MAEGDGGINPCRVKELWLISHNLYMPGIVLRVYRNFNSLNHPAALGEKHSYYANDEGN